MFNKENCIVHLTAAGALSIGFWLCRYAFLSLHGMYQWPGLLFGCGLFVTAVSFTLKAKILPAVIPTGYLISFAAGVLFQTNSMDMGGGTTNNLWMIWTLVFLGLILAAAVAEIVYRFKKSAKA